MTKKLKYLLLTLILVLVGSGLFLNRKYPSPTPQNSLDQNQATLAIDYGNGKKETSSFIPQPGQTVFDALKSLAQEKGVSLDVQTYDFGVFVKGIGGYASTNEVAWIYFVNGNSGTIAADQQEIKAGDKIEWRYLKPQQ